MKNFLKNYVLSNIQPTQETYHIEGEASGAIQEPMGTNSFLKTENNVIFYKNENNGIIFYVYDLYYFTLLKTERLTTNSVRIVNESLKQDEDGNFYLMGYVTPTNSQQEVFALVLLNNIINEQVSIRKYYTLSNYEIESEALYCEKRAGSADYLFILENADDEIKMVQLTINVQNGNSYIVWKHNHYLLYPTITGAGFQYNQETSKVLLTIYSSTDNETFVVIYNLENFEPNILHIDGENEPNIFNPKSTDGIDVNKSIYNIAVVKRIINGISNIVFCWGGRLYQYSIENEFSYPISSEDVGSLIMWFDNEYIAYEEGNAGDKYLIIKKYELLSKKINISDKYIKYSLSAFTMENYNYINIIVANFYDLSIYRIILVKGENIEDNYYTTLNLTSEYLNYNSFVPDNIAIQNTNYKYIFNRKITDKTIIGNQMTAIVNVPFNALNGETLYTYWLFGQTNKILHFEGKTIQKNIYESLYINFIKYVNVIDNNYNKNRLQNSISSLLARSIFTDLAEENYQIAPIGYIKEFKINGQAEIKQIPSNAIVQVTPYEYKINLIVNGTEVNQIQILAKDQQTPYITIPLYSTNKPVRIQQTLKFE